MGLWKAPTPAAVPVITAVPAGMVVPILQDQNFSLMRSGRGFVLTSTHVAEDLSGTENHVLSDLDILDHLAINSGEESSASCGCIVLLRTQENWPDGSELVESLQRVGIECQLCAQAKPATKDLG